MKTSDHMYIDEACISRWLTTAEATRGTNSTLWREIDSFSHDPSLQKLRRVMKVLVFTSQRFPEHARKFQALEHEIRAAIANPVQRVD
jgi:hypothetical protein